MDECGASFQQILALKTVVYCKIHNSLLCGSKLIYGSSGQYHILFPWDLPALCLAKERKDSKARQPKEEMMIRHFIRSKIVSALDKEA